MTIQEQARVTGGRRVVGRRIGLTSEARQRQLGVEVSRFLAPRVEPELAVTLADARATVGFRAPERLTVTFV